MQTSSKILLMQRLQDAARFGYHHYTTGELDDPATLHRLTHKFALIYDTELSRFTKHRRRRAGEAIAAFYALERPHLDPRYWFALVATEGIGRIHTYERLNDLRRERLQLDGYELVHDGRSWSWRMTRETFKYWRERIHRVAAFPLERRRMCEDTKGGYDPDAEQILASLYAAPGFRLARRQVGQLVTFMRGEWQRLRPHEGVQPRWRTFPGYVCRLPNAPSTANAARKRMDEDRSTPTTIRTATTSQREEARGG